MSRKGVTTKRVKTVQTALSRISAQPRSPAGRGTNVPLGQITSVRLKSRPKFQTVRPITHHDPGNNVPRSATTTLTPAAHDHAREPGSKPRGRATFSRTTADAPSEPGRRPASGRETSAKSSPSDHSRPTTNPSGHDRSDSTDGRPIVPTDRPNAAVDPKPVLKPVSYFQARLNPKPPLKDLALYI
ncbi:unnamed protein product [Microthlaspi erraticum]|uniref:Uncharacterized protein n=1 Tax=Microthlaspi erraticum TaxID=1685480 RepID=A0A6D2L2L6_9BRAS|nr:unnamed protein product [Microthlaspi erraticum]